ncbi:Oidioi.mRNA.OKI2018_I69.chr1.g523.t1.cds [Oikopleura dioica]|uniref:Oidioi.mRNA.OKI2018_I69.chr1.g523.t1.cds n=1 Tax=Oikopleura dioica TaxID=34765 RepID=A0ABN7SKL6_OIKDI|nr:Oidioi.mRNA.OKI2018_I69.chr1.g523.t1.cds [Oikopleura dioica]
MDGLRYERGIQKELLVDPRDSTWKNTCSVCGLISKFLFLHYIPKWTQSIRPQEESDRMVKFAEEIRKTESDSRSQRQSLERLSNEKQSLENENNQMKNEIKRLADENSKLKTRTSELEEENRALKEKQNENCDMNEMFEKFTVEWMERRGLSQTCKICQEMYDTNEHFQTALKCGHTFGENCIRTTLENTNRCPVCNRKANINEMNRVYS